jgi:hypothetical protein
MRTRASVGLFCVALGVSACAGARKPPAAELANDATMRSLVGTWRAVNRDGTLSRNDHYRLEFSPEVRELSLVWVSEVDDEKYGRFLKGDERVMVRFKLDGRKIDGVRAWRGTWIKIYNGYVSEDLRQLQYRLQYTFVAGDCRDAAGNACTDPEKYERVP